MEEMKEEELRKRLEGGRLGAEELAKGISIRLLNLWPATSGLRNRLQAGLYSTRLCEGGASAVGACQALRLVSQTQEAARRE